LLNRAGDILFIGLLRHLIAHPKNSGGLFNGLADPRIARALVAMHARPQDGWTLERLAEEAGMSRTSFANAFREVMCQTPGKYLSKLRLAIAQEAVSSGLGLKRAAKDSGYLSSSALSRALARSKLIKFE
jgi:transcriptional regulator GlxA family with amidase domain